MLAAFDCNTSDSPESGGRRHPHAPAAIPRFARLRLRWRRKPFGCLIGSLYLKQATVHEKIPATAGRSGQPPPTGWLRHSAVFVSLRRAADPHPSGVLLAAFTLIRSRARRRPHAEGATRPTRDRLRRRQALVEATSKRRNASDSKSRRPAALPLRRGRTASLAGCLYPKRGAASRYCWGDCNSIFAFASLLSATSGRAGQPPPIGWLRHSAVLVSLRRAADPHPLGVLLAASTPTSLYPTRENCPRTGSTSVPPAPDTP